MTKSKVSFSHWGARPHGKTIGYAVKMKGQKKHTKFITVLDGSFEKEMNHNLIWYSNLSILEVKFFLFWDSPKAPKTQRSSAQTWESWGNRLHMTSSPQQNRRPKIRLVREGLCPVVVWVLYKFECWATSCDNAGLLHLGTNAGLYLEVANIQCCEIWCC